MELSKMGKAVLAGFVADAATLPLHWHYDVSKLKALLLERGRVKNPEFLSPMATQYYSAKDFPGHYDLGQLSCYSEQSVMTLEYFKANDGQFKGGESFAQFMYKWFGEYTGRQDHPTKEFMEKAKKLSDESKALYPDAGADDVQTMHSFKIPVIALVMMDGNEELFYNAVNEASLAHQNNPMISSFAKAYALMLKNVSDGMAIGAVVEAMIKGDIEVDAEVKSALEYTLERKSLPAYDDDGWDAELQQFGVDLSAWLFEKYGGGENMKSIIGLTCRFPGSFMVSLKIILDTIEQYPKVDDFNFGGLSFAIRRNILFGGDNCGRTFVIAPLMVLAGAEIPGDFMSQMNEEDLKKFTSLIMPFANRFAN